MKFRTGLSGYIIMFYGPEAKRLGKRSGQPSQTSKTFSFLNNVPPGKIPHSTIVLHCNTPTAWSVYPHKMSLFDNTIWPNKLHENRNNPDYPTVFYRLLTKIQRENISPPSKTMTKRNVITSVNAAPPPRTSLTYRSFLFFIFFEIEIKFLIVIFVYIHERRDINFGYGFVWGVEGPLETV